MNELVADKKRRKSVMLERSASWKMGTIKKEEKEEEEEEKKEKKKEKKKEDEESAELALVVVNNQLVPVVSVVADSQSNPLKSLLDIQRDSYMDPQWMGLQTPAPLCCEHYPIQIKGDVQCNDCGGKYIFNSEKERACKSRIWM